MRRKNIYFFKSILLAGIFVLGMSFSLMAQEQMKISKTIEHEIDEEIMWIQEEAAITIGIATKTEKKIEDAPGSVTVISREELRRRNIRTVDEAFSELAGIFVKRTKGLMDTGDFVTMRGFNDSEYMLVLLDGQPLNDGYTASLRWAVLPVDNIEKIEIIRGAASALYGGNAVGGVVNIITSTPKSLEMSATGGYGTNDTKRYRVSLGNRFAEKLSIGIGYEKEVTDGYVTTPVVRTIKNGEGNVSGGYPMNDDTGNITQWVVGDRGIQNGEKYSFYGKAGFDFSDTGNISLTVIQGHHEYDYEPPNTYMGTLSGSAVSGEGFKADFSPNDFIYGGIAEDDTDIYTLSFRELFGRIHVNAQTGLRKTEYGYAVESGGAEKNYYDCPGSLTLIDTETWFSEIHGDIPIGKNHTLLAGFSFRTDKADTNEYDVPYYRSFSDKSSSTFHSGGKDEIWAVFLEDEWKISETFALYLGGRYDSWQVSNGSSGESGDETQYESNNDAEFSPRAAGVWKAFSDTIFRASIGSAFRPPNIYELYRTRSTRTATYEGNPNLSPETVRTYEAGVEQYLFDRKARVSLTGYRNDIDDLIYYKDDTENKTKTRMNAGKARTHGLELEASYNIHKNARLWGNYTYTYAKITDNPLDPASEDKYVAGVPKTTWNLGLDVYHQWFKGSLAGRYFSKIYNNEDNTDIEEGVYQTYEPAFYLDGKITFIPYKWAKWAEFSLSVDNMLDEDYYEYYIQDERTFLFEITLRY
ncbi:TonB-dependent receptor-like superfamily protein [Desulfonema limicola]|uniref:TonB-dependent receptor-like superfamily protein n=1 Tax=Desulfonema limicola TaxID=45656 RepID=A0A975BBM4_9BACT|nr:TonB-dependent receptor [Desulfonema limicola]QTA82280.1 TonB-dependent receptor-like superfamily protein [Desulfonema limicola]